MNNYGLFINYEYCTALFCAKTVRAKTSMENGSLPISLFPPICATSALIASRKVVCPAVYITANLA